MIRPWLSRAAPALLGVVLIAGALAACQDVTHERIDRWQKTERGPDRLEAALSDGDLSAELRAHAAQNLVAIRGYAAIRDPLEAMGDSERPEVVAALAPRLWEDARLDERMARPSAVQEEAKDALFELRDHADGDTLRAIDDYLIEWLAGGYYEGRAGAGRTSGRDIVRAIGAEAAPDLLAEARRIIVQPADEDGRRLAVGDRLLAALAVTGSAEAVEFLLDLATGDSRGDDALPVRVMTALANAYLEPRGPEPPPAQALAPHTERLAAIARDGDADPAVINSAVRLIGAAGAPDCIEPLADLLRQPHESESFRWMAAQQATRCAGAEALAVVLDNLPQGERYRRGILERYVWQEALSKDGEQRIAEAARELLDADSWVARASGIELLGMLALEESAAEDAARLRELADDGALLLGWNDGAERRANRDPTVRERATEVARALEKVAK